MTDPFAERLLSWYAKNARSLPWRGRSDPYAVWVSEVMLQQTRVETVIPYYQRWMERFPTIQVLANAPLQEALLAWEGLGYYSRARNLHQAAVIVMQRYGGKLPGDRKALQALPGIGRYTAGAIASIAFGRDEPVLDGNIRRVLARVFQVSEVLRSSTAEKKLWELAVRHLPAGQAGDYNQALMELGALVCLPRSPVCPRCPLMEICRAYALNLQDELPVKAARAELPHITVTAAVIQQDGRVLITQRPAKGLLGGLWEFPGGKLLPGEDLVECLQREIREELGVTIAVGTALGVYRHAYTHFRVTLYAFACALPEGSAPQPLQPAALRWVMPEELQDYPMGKIDRQIASRLASAGSCSVDPC